MARSRATPPDRPRQKRSNKRVLVRDTAARFFMEQGYQGTSMDQIAAATGLNKGTLYFYFKSKADILFEIYDMSGKLIVERTRIEDESADALDDIRALMSAIIVTIFEHQVETAVYFREEAWLQNVLTEPQLATVRATQREFNANCTRVFDRAKAAGAIRDLPTADYFHVMLGATSGAYRWIKKKSSPDDIAARIADILIDGMRTP
jgi:TetR/AcrR family transcriptional regulator, cholesterol catabolism regulator